jgi:hypothetical protein
MRNLPAESGHEESGGGGSAFADFISRLQPYPPPPGFQLTLLYAAGGAVALLVAGIFVAALPTDLEGDGFHAIGASEFELILGFFAAPSSAFIVLGFIGLGVTALVGMRRRMSETTGAILAALTMIGVVALLWSGVGWAVWGVVSLANLFLWLLVLSAIPLAGFLLLRGALFGAVATLVIAMAFASVLQQAASDPVPSSQAGVSQEAPAPPGTESPSVSPAVERREEEAERRQQQYQRKRQALVQRRIALEARMDAEFAGWREVPYVPPCGQQERRAELDSLREIFARMKRALRSAARHVEAGVFRNAGDDLERMGRAREQALANPAASYEEFGGCPGGAGALRFIW